MAIVNEILVGRYNRFIQKLLSMKGQATLVQMSGELVAAIDTLNGVENRYLEGWDQFGIGGSNAPNAAGLAGTRIRNPAGSNVVCVVERLSIQPTAADLIQFEIGATLADYAVASASPGIDPRGRPHSTCITSVTNGATTGTSMGGGFKIGQVNTTAANQNYEFMITDGNHIPLLPGMALNVFGGQNNISYNSIYRWRERFLEDSERT